MGWGGIRVKKCIERMERGGIGVQECTRREMETRWERSLGMHREREWDRSRGMHGESGRGWDRGKGNQG